MTQQPPQHKHLLVRAALGEEVERPPVWAMRQAGRWDPEFMKLRGNLPFYDFSENVELAAKASLLARRFGVDAIILFYDITTLTVAMRLPFTLQPGKGPVPASPVRSLADVERLEATPDPQQFRHIIELLHSVQNELAGQLPIIAFAGAPFTVATYCIGTGKDLNMTRHFIKEYPQVWERLLGRLQEATVHFLKTLIRSGADVVQLFDSWAGALERSEYLNWAQTHHEAIWKQVIGVPRILFVKEGPYLDLMTKSGAEVISLGKRHDLAAALRNYPNLVFQGNVSEELMRSGTPEQVAETTRRCVEAGGGRRHIVNLSHGLDLRTPVANFEAYVQAVTAYRCQPRVG
ncbi:MAG: uroporphyrinogen decarboxylase family protein [Planctomycetes bacterium]|nr:uroporphyrinogen decarboxylase family protein [Planctomycetota bacterium]